MPESKTVRMTKRASEEGCLFWWAGTYELNITGCAVYSRGVAWRSPVKSEIYGVKEGYRICLRVGKRTHKISQDIFI